mmetsp:Transcript_14957/g.36769  ORF Transcript_14957/g.36769 Transcript_14957/m.36769 type:complete len:185 (+) Transcript_14957:61-615(+)
MRVAVVLAVVVVGRRGPAEEDQDNDSSCYDPSDKGASYRGLESFTKSGRACQAWDSQHPHPINMAAVDGDAYGIGQHNYCRNPDEEMESPWCYTMDSAMEKELCNVKECREDNTVAGLEAERMKLQSAMHWHDCECADQLFGSTETTDDTSVPGDFLQAQARGRALLQRARPRLGVMREGKCMC